MGNRSIEDAAAAPATPRRVSLPAEVLQWGLPPMDHLLNGWCSVPFAAMATRKAE